MSAKDIVEWPLQRKLNDHVHVTLDALSLDCIRAHPSFASVADRLYHQDPVSGCLDADVVGSRDTYVVTLKDHPDTPLTLYCFLAHLVSPSTLKRRLCGEPDYEGPEDALLERMWEDGTWAGFILWDAAMHMIDQMLTNRDLGALVSGKRVLELGCGLGLPGFVCHKFLGAEHVLLTDRVDVVQICQDNLQFTQCSDGISTRTLEWDNPVELEECGEVDVLLAADCICRPIYGDSFPLWDVIHRLSDLAIKANRTPPIVLVSVERRHNDGLEDFIAVATNGGADVQELWAFEERVYLYKLQVKPSDS